MTRHYGMPERINPPEPEAPMGSGNSFAVIASLDLAAWAFVIVVGMCVYKFAWPVVLTMVGW